MAEEAVTAESAAPLESEKKKKVQCCNILLTRCLICRNLAFTYYICLSFNFLFTGLFCLKRYVLVTVI